MTLKNKGFTLIELLVVIAIIGILASVVLASLNTARLKARNARRISDIKNLQLALELYADDNGGNYPAGLIDLVSTYIATTSGDPLDGVPYRYYSEGGGVEYHIGTDLEGNSNLPSNDAQCESLIADSTNCFGWTGNDTLGFDGRAVGRHSADSVIYDQKD